MFVIFFLFFFGRDTLCGIENNESFELFQILTSPLGFFPPSIHSALLLVNLFKREKNF